ncbi:MAG: DNA-binding protein [Clostridiales bacterium]|nr:DNA-binding protein [Clostridiales bacterium]
MKEKQEKYILNDINYEIEEVNQEDLIAKDVNTNPSYIVVHVEGEVVRPGLYELSGDSRVYDAVEAAGGLKSTAARKSINLAKKISDEEFIYIPSEDEKDFPIQTINNNQSIDNIQGIININTADKNQLQNLPGIGPALSERIIDYREQNGLFKTIEDIQNVSGIGEKKFNDIKDKITVK